MEKKKYVKPDFAVIEARCNAFIATSGIEGYSNRQGTGEVYSNERRVGFGDRFGGDNSSSY